MASARMTHIATGVLGEATLRELNNGLTGSVVGPADSSYGTARRAWNHTIDNSPALVVSQLHQRERRRHSAVPAIHPRFTLCKPSRINTTRSTYFDST